MTAALLTIASGALLGCAGGPKPTQASLTCRSVPGSETCFGFFSFREGELPLPLADAGAVDLVYVFDGDDCARGALLGSDDRAGFLFPIGHLAWPELLRLEPPSEDAPSVEAIASLSEDDGGLCFWVKSASGAPVLVRLTHVEPATYAELRAGATPTLTFEWMSPRRAGGGG